MRKLQIGVMGSMADLNYSQELALKAEAIGYWIAKKGAVLVFGAEKDADSLSTSACRGAKRGGGITLGVTYGKGLNGTYEQNVDIMIASGMDRGGGREFVLSLSCDAIITIGGGSGTLTEIAVAYQANIPIIVLTGTGGWSDKLAGQFLDERKRIKIIGEKNPKRAVMQAIKLVESRTNV